MCVRILPGCWRYNHTPHANIIHMQVNRANYSIFHSSCARIRFTRRNGTPKNTKPNKAHGNCWAACIMAAPIIWFCHISIFLAQQHGRHRFSEKFIFAMAQTDRSHNFPLIFTRYRFVCIRNAALTVMRAYLSRCCVVFGPSTVKFPFRCKSKQAQ